MSAADVSPERCALKRLCLGKMLDAPPERLALARFGSSPACAARRADAVYTHASATSSMSVPGTTIATRRFIEAHRNVVVLGPVGVDKTFLPPAPSGISPAVRVSTSTSSAPMGRFEHSKESDGQLARRAHDGALHHRPADHRRRRAPADDA
jgi:hypothetical protein